MREQKNKSSQLALPGCEDLVNQARLPALGSATRLCSNRRSNTSRKARRTMETRQQKGLEIAALFKIERKGKSWVVPSQSGNGGYKVEINSDSSTCTCLDFQQQQNKC